MRQIQFAQLLKVSKSIMQSILAASGILIDKITPLRLIVIVSIFANITLTYFYYNYITFNFAISFFIFMFLMRYVILFASFGNKGFATNLIARLGEERAYAYYEAVTGFMFFYRSTSFNFLVLQTAFSLELFSLYHSTFIVIAWIMIIVATIVNVWGTMIIGVDVYYYKDMFVRRPIGKFVVKGPFKYFSNPMYGIGQLNSYGLALLSGSIFGILAAALNQITMYIFYYLCEKPHIERVFGKNKLK